MNESDAKSKNKIHKILIVDDEAPVRRTLQQRLGAEGRISQNTSA